MVGQFIQLIGINVWHFERAFVALSQLHCRQRRMVILVLVMLNSL